MSTNLFIFLFFCVFCLQFHHCHDREDIDVKFPRDSEKFVLSANYFELENRLKETKWKKDRTLEDLQREQELLDHAKFKYEAKKKEFVCFLAESSSYLTQVIPQSCAIILF